MCPDKNFYILTQKLICPNMKATTLVDVYNCLAGNGGSGKTSLAEQMLFMTKGTDRFGKTADGNTTCDYDAEEIKRQISIISLLIKVFLLRLTVCGAPSE